MGDEDGLARQAEQHGVGLPVAGLSSRADVGGPVMDRAAPRRLEPCRPDAPAAFVFGARQIEAPAPIVGAFELGIDEAIDGLVADDLTARFTGEAAVW